MTTTKELQELERKQKAQKNLKGSEKALDILGSSGGGSLLSAPFRLAKVLKDNAKKIYLNLTAPERMQKQQDLKKISAYKKKQLGAELKAQQQKEKQAQKQAIKNEQLREKINTRLSGDNPKRNPLASAPTSQLAPSPKVDVGAKLGEFKQQQVQNKAKGVGLPLANPQAREQMAKQQMAKQKNFQKLQNKPVKQKLGFNNPNTLQKPKPMDVGGKVQKFQSNYNKNVAKGLSNPVNKPSAEDKIKNIMGVN